MQTINFRLTGTGPLLFHNVRLANPFDKYAARLSELNTEKKKKGADKLGVMRQMAAVEWEGGLYHTETDPGVYEFVGPYIPGNMVRACLVDGAKMTRGGATVQRAVFIPKAVFPLEFTGPKDLKSMAAETNFMDQRMVVVGQAKVPRTRPIFHDWAVSVAIAYDETAITRDDLVRYMQDAATYHGFGDGRKLGFGRFMAVEQTATKKKSSSRSAATGDNGVGHHAK